MSAVTRLEHAKGGPFTYRLGGQVRGLPSPVEMTPDVVLAILEHGYWAFPDFPRMPAWAATQVLERWIAHFDLPVSRDLQRLIYLLDRYSNALEFDLRVYAGGADLGSLWRSRQWRLLINLIDHLPGHSHFSAGIANDEEHAQLLAEAMVQRSQERGEKKPKRSLAGWTPEVAVIADLIDEVRALRHTTVMMNMDSKSAAPKPPDAYERPGSALQDAVRRAEFNRRKAAHDSLVSRLLPHKRG